jgi:hypothetical protein
VEPGAFRIDKAPRFLHVHGAADITTMIAQKNRLIQWMAGPFFIVSAR